ncbi:MAG TPA: hypothetical protein PKD18_18935 [Saprospiraceae bacterium]|nr:hypothetical protein [Saprospiraceae bacterium]
MNKYHSLFASVLLTLMLISCGSQPEKTPKPHMYPRVIFPQKHYVSFDQAKCNMTFEYPDYMAFEQDTNFFEEKPLDPCWFDLEAKGLMASLHFSYYPIQNRARFDELVTDVFKLVGEHNIKANYRNEQIIDNADQNVHGLYFEIEGAVASPLQFYLSDSTRNFVRASLYFNSKVNADSTKIVYDFIKQDVDRMIETWKWTNQ